MIQIYQAYHVPCFQAQPIPLIPLAQRGRPKKEKPSLALPSGSLTKRGRGRPRKIILTSKEPGANSPISGQICLENTSSGNLELSPLSSPLGTPTSKALATPTSHPSCSPAVTSEDPAEGSNSNKNEEKGNESADRDKQLVVVDPEFRERGGSGPELVVLFSWERDLV